MCIFFNYFICCCFGCLFVCFFPKLYFCRKTSIPSFSLLHALSGLQQHKGMCSLTSPSENYYRKPATKYKLSNQSQSQPHRCWDPKMLSWTKELTTETQLSLLANTTSSETMNSCFREVFRRNVFC